MLAVVGGAMVSPDLIVALSPALAPILALTAPSHRTKSVDRVPSTRSVDEAGPEFVAQHPLGAGTIPPVR